MEHYDMPRTPCAGAPLAMAYVPPQPFQGLYDADLGLNRGTVFQALDLPFLGKAGREA